MKVNGLFLSTVFWIVVSTMQLHAQRFQAGADFLIGIPQGAFKQNLQRNGFGGTGHIGFAPEQNPFLVGLEVAYLNYGSESRTEPFSTTIPDVFVNVKTTNNFLGLHLTVRLQPNSGKVRPYVGGLVGGNYLFTTTTIQNAGNLNQEVASSTNVSDWAFSYGGGGGIMILVHAREEDGKPQEFLIDVGARYLVGGELQYLKEGSIRRENGSVVYDLLHSKTDLLGIMVGLTFRF